MSQTTTLEIEHPRAGWRIKTGFAIFIVSLVLPILLPVLLLTALFLLGGDFWDKLRALFIHKAVAVIPDKPVGAQR